MFLIISLFYLDMSMNSLDNTTHNVSEETISGANVSVDRIYFTDLSSDQSSMYEQPAIGDVNNDGHIDIIAVYIDEGRNYYLTCYDGLTGEAIWKLRDRYEIKYQPLIIDANNDGIKEIIVGDKGGNILFLNGSNGIPIWNITVNATVTSPIIPYMINGDTYFTFGTNKGVYSINKLGELNWVYTVNHSIQQITVGDINNDNVLDVFALSYGGEDSYIYALNGVSGDTIWSKNVNMSTAYKYFHKFMYFGDFDKDGTPNILVVWEDLNDKIINLNAITGEVNWITEFKVVLDNGGIADIDGDGIYEFVTIDFVSLTFVDLADGSVEQFDIPYLERSFSLVIGNFDNDPDLEIFTGTQIINNVGGIWVASHYLFGIDVIYSFVADIDGDGVIELFALTWDYGLILAFAKFKQPVQYRVFWNGINGDVNGSKSLAYIDLDGDGLATGEELVFGTNPFLSDSDKDSIPDGWEVYYSLDPIKNDASIDSDKDGLTNLQEYHHGTDPYSQDTDNDGLTDGLEVYIFSDPNNPCEPVYSLFPIIVFLLTIAWGYRSGVIRVLREAIVVDKMRFKEYLEREKERRKREIERKTREREARERLPTRPVNI